MSEPLVYADLWRPVMEAAGFRCQCVGQCGGKHAKSQGRCPREHDQPASKHRGPVRLLAAPTNPLTPPVAACRLPMSDLWAWCPDCHTAAHRAAHRTQAAQPEGQDGLF
ncbi:hypothetical protein ACFWU3_15085 [Streptomyces sp. NPDC058685]|uniref:hypothetical protein n=1 Tax=Streptomyces sp. NPDC058685 TaxID=3346598 RepID=UPI00364AFF40